MADSVRERIILFLLDKLNGVGGGTVPVGRSVLSALKSNKLPQIIVRPSEEAITPGAHGEDDRTLSIRVILVTGDPNSDGGAIDQKADGILTEMEQLIAEDPTFGGLTLSAEPTRIAWSMEDMDVDYLGAEMTVEVEYYTQLGDPATSAA